MSRTDDGPATGLTDADMQRIRAAAETEDIRAARVKLLPEHARAAERDHTSDRPAVGSVEEPPMDASVLVSEGGHVYHRLDGPRELGNCPALETVADERFERMTRQAAEHRAKRACTWCWGTGGEGA